jgi:ABC-type transport system substrate-binding protein/class 3 adenylate cyclase
MTTIAGERRIVTVLFADLVGSTAMSEQLGPERFTLLIDEVMRTMSGEVERFEGTVVQFIGDELYAVFGAPLSHEDDSERAVRAALAIQEALGRYASDVEEAYGVELAVRIAINTGPVVLRPESDDPYNALGDTINVASRIQKLVSGGEIVIGRATKAQVESYFELEGMGRQDLRGLSEPVETFRVLGVLEAVPDAPASPLVSRDFELTVLERVMDGLVDGRGAVVSVTGEPGIGKTRLLIEAAKGYRDRIRFIEGRGVSYAASFPYWPIRDLLREWLGVGISTPEARVRLDLKAELGKLFAEEADVAYPFIASLIGITLEPDAMVRIKELSRESLQHEIFDWFWELVSRLSKQTSLALVFDDLHWADDATLELLEALLPVTEEDAVGIFLLYRSEREHGSWRLGDHARQRHPHRYREIELRPLPEDAGRALAASVAGAELPRSVADLLVDRAGGNPFFLEEALRDLDEQGILRRENGRVVVTVNEHELAIPMLVQGALQARIDRLDPATRETLSTSAVIGRTFGMPLLELILPHDQLVQALSELQRLDLVVETSRRPSPEYRFRHGLVQEVAYASLLETKRRKLHGRVGEALERLYPDSKDEIYGLLARHFAEADVPEKAAEYLLKAGDAARALYADQEALDHYRRARDFLARLGDDGRARETLFKMALAHHVAFDFKRAEEAYDEAFSCRVVEEPPPVPTEAISTAMEKLRDVLVPGSTYSTEEAMLIELLFRGLLMVNRELNVVPSMADNFRVSSDGLTYLFRLREGGTWSDGVPLTADDFVYAWDRVREEEAVTAFLLEDIASAEALDARTLEVRVHEPRSYFPYILASPWSFPRPRHVCEELGEAWREQSNLVCNGPFALAELSSENAVLKANPHWRGPRGNVLEVRIDLGRMSSEIHERWRAGEYDVVTVAMPSLAESADTLAEANPGLGTHYVAFRADRAPFSSELVRRAFAHALNRDPIAAHISPLGRPAGRGGAIPPALPGHSHRIAPEYDPNVAAQLLAEAGYPGGAGLPELGFAVPNWLRDAAPFIEQWGALGARVNLVPVGEHCFGEPPSEADLWLNGWTADYPDPDGFFRGLLQGSEAAHYPLYRDDEIEELLERARSLQNQGERLRLYHELDKRWVGDRAALVPICYGRWLTLRRPWIDRLWSNPMSGLHLDEVVVTPRSGSRSDGGPPA